MNLFDLLACPTCKTSVTRQIDTVVCSQCRRSYPIINDVPVLLPDGSVPSTQYQHELNVRQSYDPWVHRIVLQSLPANSVILDLGAGNMAFSLPNVIRMDVTLTPYVDVVGDAHALPFLPKTFDFIFSLAVVEHLRQPFVAAQEMYNALRYGGYVYGECNFVFPYHGYPHHYFNASQQGLEHVFASFMRLRSGVAPYQMPSFAVRALLESYRRDLAFGDEHNTRRLQHLLQQVLDLPLGTYDGYFSEDVALRTAAGTFFFGVKLPEGRSEVIPAGLQQLWKQTPTLQDRFPDIHNLGTDQNILLWAKHEGREHYQMLTQYFDSVEPFRKNTIIDDTAQQLFAAEPIIDPGVSHIPDVAREQRAQADSEVHHTIETLHAAIRSKDQELHTKNQHITHLETLLKQIESGRIMRILQRVERIRKGYSKTVQGKKQ